jgi:hypothetical protein
VITNQLPSQPDDATGIERQESGHIPVRIRIFIDGHARVYRSQTEFQEHMVALGRLKRTGGKSGTAKRSHTAR